jgi:salicylate hydroxylase
LWGITRRTRIIDYQHIASHCWKINSLALLRSGIIAKSPTYAKGQVCMMGDAAHAMTPWQSAGLSQAIGDAMIFGTLLQEVKEPSQLNAAFRAYDEVRRPGTQQIVASAKITSRIMCGRGPGIGLDINKLREVLPPRWKVIYILGMKEHKMAALAAFSSTIEQNH